MSNTPGTTENDLAFSPGIADLSICRWRMRGRLQRIAIPNDSAIELTQIGKDASAGMQEAHTAGHDYGDIGSRLSGAEDRQSSLNASGALTHALQAMMALSPTHGIAWVDANSIVPDMQHQIMAVRQVDSQQTSVGVGFSILDGFDSNSIQFIANDRMQFLCISYH